MQGPEILIPLLSIAGFFAAAIVWIYMHYSSRYKERMALLEYGKDADVYKPHKRERNKTLKYGIVAVMVGVGIFMGNILDGLGMMEEAAYGSMVLLMGGAGLVGYYFMQEKKREDDREKESDTL